MLELHQGDLCFVMGDEAAARSHYARSADEPFGIWGGFDQDERRTLRRQLQRRGELQSAATDSAA